MVLTREGFDTIINKAEAAGACREAIAELRALPPGDYSEDDRMPGFALWYAAYVVCGRWREVEHVIARCPRLRSVYTYHNHTTVPALLLYKIIEEKEGRWPLPIDISDDEWYI